MPLNLETYRLADEVDRLNDEMDEVAETMTGIDEEARDTEQAQAIHQQGKELEAQRNGLLWAIDEYGEDAEVTLGGLTAGEHAWVGDNSRTGTSAARGVANNHMAAAGVDDAPFLDGTEGKQQRLEIVSSQLPAMFVRWLTVRVEVATSLEPDEGNSFEELVAAQSDSTNDRPRTPATSSTNSER